MKYKLSATLAAIALTGVTHNVYAEGKLNLVCSATVDVCESLAKGFSEKADVDVNMVRLSSGEVFARVRAEARNPKLDIWWGGTGEPHLQAAELSLTEPYKSKHLPELHDWAVSQAKSANYRTVGVYSGVLGIAYNTELLAKKGIEPPKCWEDLLNPKLEGEIQVANPNSSGTAYSVLATLSQLMGENEAYLYLMKMNENVSQYTKSGSAPVKSAARGENAVAIVYLHDAIKQSVKGFPIETVAPCEGTGYEIGSMSIVKGARNAENARLFYDWVLTPDAQSRLKDVGSYQLPSNKSSTIPEKAPRLEETKLIDFDFVTYGSSETRIRLLKRWDAEVGVLAK
ncbi:ABC transporter substrate-binding protein [Vibrio penaeicida]|uniref:Iron ABC transporter substrate-binding protein n=1 Tax=Vibrio penaeicida TaxID=104609 RepID=A0AAV5NW66_9VIBR|nr:ABC transporter substrate-binding protein [Vibrio penaeicida]RTZ20557.1 ABC transporter substrate-binding protein [Vibrio penaeicida]GLQ74673.1 iron ABC transporter substrate-binding protein [Vibrio penaeicida]